MQSKQKAIRKLKSVYMQPPFFAPAFGFLGIRYNEYSTFKKRGFMKIILIVVLTALSFGTAAGDYKCRGYDGKYKQYFLKCKVQSGTVRAYTDMFTGIANSAFIVGRKPTTVMLYELRLDWFLDDLAMRCDQKNEKLSCDSFRAVAESVERNNLTVKNQTKRKRPR